MTTARLNGLNLELNNERQRLAAAKNQKEHDLRTMWSAIWGAQA
jgi:hypothetical protein